MYLKANRDFFLIRQKLPIRTIAIFVINSLTATSNQLVPQFDWSFIRLITNLSVVVLKPLSQRIDAIQQAKKHRVRRALVPRAKRAIRAKSRYFSDLRITVRYFWLMGSTKIPSIIMEANLGRIYSRVFAAALTILKKELSNNEQTICSLRTSWVYKI